MAQSLQLPRTLWPLRATPPAPTASLARAESDIAAACFEAHPEPQLVLDAACAVVSSNRAARELLESADGPRALAESLVAGAGGLLRDLGDGVAAAIRSQVAPPELELSLPPAHTFSARIVPLGGAHERVLLVLRPRELGAQRSGRERFGFTPMESEVAALLCRGLTAAKIARQLGISIETVRCHLKQTFVKACVHRQAELVALLLTS